mmetsp:Transcript_16857/g.40048  ORF Transcript_16857/g.40048 Transcript_16857/m.40048 type:complete len:184 (-) Transcript_16857:60-611(-)
MPAAASAACPDGQSPALRLTYYSKAYVTEPCYDDPLFQLLAAANPQPTHVVIGIGLWDMLYTRNSLKFKTGVSTLLASLKKSGLHSRLVWLEVTAISELKLPAFKMGSMTTALASALNTLAADALREGLRQDEVMTVPLFELTRAAPELSPDGVHYPRLLSIAARTLDAFCERKPSTFESARS